jgi:hypothetical protein
VLWVVATISASHAVGPSNGSVVLRPGTVVKGSATDLFDLGPASLFTAVGTADQPIVITSIEDDLPAGDSLADGPAAVVDRVENLFTPEQFSGNWEAVAGAFGVDLRRIGPGLALIDHAVIRNVETAVAFCLACLGYVHNTDFDNVVVGVSQSYYFTPISYLPAPCQPLTGNGTGVFALADARLNHWGGAGGPSASIDYADFLLELSQAQAQYQLLRLTLTDQQRAELDALYAGVGTAFGDVPVTSPGGNAATNLGLQVCQLPFINVGIPVLVGPVNSADWFDARIHPLAGLEEL